jgi:hypothetical protein
MFRASTVVTRLALGLTAISLAIFIPTHLPSSSTRAYHIPGMKALSIDMQETATPANTSSALGTRETCARINENDVLDADEDLVDGLKIDVTATDVPAYDDNGTPSREDDSGGITFFQYELYYSLENLTVADHEYDNPAVHLLQRNPGSVLTNGGDTTPDDNSDDYWYALVSDEPSERHIATSAPEDGSGVLGRLTLATEPAAVGGVYPLTIYALNDGYGDAVGHVYDAQTIENAFVAVNTACPSEAPGRIVFDTNRDGEFEIYAMNPDGTGLVRLTKNRAFDIQPAWSPDGTKIAFTSFRDGNDEIYAMNADGTE